MADHEDSEARQRRLVESMKEMRATSPNLASLVRTLPDVRATVRRLMAGMTSESVEAVGFTEVELEAIGALSDEEREKILSAPKVPEAEAMQALRERYARAVAEGAKAADDLEIAKAQNTAAKKELAGSVRNLFHAWRSAGRPPSKRVLSQLRQSLGECDRLGVVRPVELTPVEKRMLGVRDG